MFHRYVAIGDSTTEGLEDPYPDGGYRGWADRLAEHIANAQDGPLEYANLAVRGLRMKEICDTQLERALAFQPDLMTIVGGVNDVLSGRCDYQALREHFDLAFGRARDQGATVLTFTMPDPSALSPLGRRVKDQIFVLNDLVRAAADRHGALVMDFQRHPVAEDPRLWFEDRLHGNPQGHARVAAALAWRLRVAGADESWSEPLDDAVARRREQLAADLGWALHYLTPWLIRRLRGIPESRNVTAKRPVPTVVAKTLGVAVSEGAMAEDRTGPLGPREVSDSADSRY